VGLNRDSGSASLGVSAHPAGIVRGFRRSARWSLFLFGVALLPASFLAAPFRAAQIFPLLPLSLADQTSTILNISILVFREGLECVLVLAAVVAGVHGPAQKDFRRPVALGVALGFVATLITWRIAVGVLDGLESRISALALQAATGLLAILVLLLVMNWFFHRTYWTGWISLQNSWKKDLLDQRRRDGSERRVFWGLALLGLTCFYREGFEVVLFLQGYRLRFGGLPVLLGTLAGAIFTALVAVVTFVLHRRLPYRKMLVVTGVMLAFVLLVMVGEQAQEMQLAGWLPKTTIPVLLGVFPAWAGAWFSLFPTAETLAAQFIAAALVLGSYMSATSSQNPSR